MFRKSLTTEQFIERSNIDPTESADVDNCITLCGDCHNKVHNSGQCDVRRQKCII